MDLLADFAFSIQSRNFDCWNLGFCCPNLENCTAPYKLLLNYDTAHPIWNFKQLTRQLHVIKGAVRSRKPQKSKRRSRIQELIGDRIG
eukprot:822455-Pleurochrysis_carterae.AAC.1